MPRVVTDEEIVIVAQNYKLSGDPMKLNGVGVEISKLPTIRKLANATMLMSLITDPQITIEMLAATCLMMGIEIGEKRALEDMTKASDKL